MTIKGSIVKPNLDPRKKPSAQSRTTEYEQEQLSPTITPQTSQDIVSPPLPALDQPAQGPTTTQDSVFSQEYRKLSDMTLRLTSKGVKEALSLLLSKVLSLQEQNTTQATEILKLTHQRLTNKIDHEHYNSVAKTMQGKPSVAMKIVGGLMAALGLALAGLSIAFAPAILAIAGTTAASVAIAGGSGAIAATGFGIFAVGFRQTGMSGAMKDLSLAQDRHVAAQSI